jgi:glutathione S-transferase
MLLQREGFEAGRNVPGKHVHIELNGMGEEEMDRLAEGGRKWQREARESNGGF